MLFHFSNLVVYDVENGAHFAKVICLMKWLLVSDFLLSNAATYAIKILSALPFVSLVLCCPFYLEICTVWWKPWLVLEVDAWGSFLHGTFDSLILLICVSFQIRLVLVLTSLSYLNHEPFVIVIGIWVLGFVSHFAWGWGVAIVALCDKCLC